MHITIENGHLIDPANQVNAQLDIFIVDGKVAAIGNPPDGFVAEQRIDATDKIVCPGLIDLATRLREPGQTHKGTIASETRAAAAGGVTTLCVLPDTSPVIDTSAVVELIHQRAEAAGYAKVLPIGALSKGLAGEQLSELASLKTTGCIGVSNLHHDLASSQVMRSALEYAASNDITVFLYAEDNGLSNNGCAHEGVMSVRLGLPGIPEAAETHAVANYLMLIEQSGVRAHFCRLSTARAIQMIGRAKYDGLAITADVAAHQLHLTEMDIGYFNSICHVRPPLRTQRDMEALRQAIASGRIEAICSDHQPHDVDAKLAPFADTEPGVSAVEFLLPLSLRLMDSTSLEMHEIIQRITQFPAQILDIDAGQLGIGSCADICIFDPQARWTVSTDNILSRGHNTPFIGWELKGRVSHTLLNGKIVYEHK